MSEDKKWYSLRVISGKERKIKERIDAEILRNEWNSFISSVVVPTEKVYKIRNGKKVISERNILPGYLLVEAVAGKLSGEIVQVIANVPNVIHFLGKNTPERQLHIIDNLRIELDDAPEDAESLAELA
jgi:transcriptional antiterminator NusG